MGVRGCLRFLVRVLYPDSPPYAHPRQKDRLMFKTKPAHPDGSRLDDFLTDGPLLPAEKKLRTAVAWGEDCVIAPTRPEGPTGKNRIRPDFLRFLALGGDDTTPVHTKGIQLTGAWIGNRDWKDSDLDLDSCTVEVPLILKLCDIDGTVKLEDARLQSVTLDGSQIGELKGDGARFDGSLNLRRHPSSQHSPATPFKAHGEVCLLGATISGNLECGGGMFWNAGGNALICDLLKVTGTVSLNDHFEAHGEVHLPAATIEGNLECGGGTFKDPSTKDENRSALHCDGIKVTGDVFFNERFKANGEVRLLGATIGGDLACCGGMFQNAGGDALSCDRLKVTGGVFLNDHVKADGFKERFKADGAVRLLGATIGGNLECGGGMFWNAGGNALSCNRLKVTGNVSLNNNFEAHGAVRLLSATIGGNLSCRGGTFWNAGGNALSCNRLKVTGNVSLNNNFEAHGAVRLLGATIGGNLACIGGCFVCRRPARKGSTRCAIALHLQAAEIHGALLFRQPVPTVEGSIKLNHAHVRVLVDDAASWPKGTVQDAKTGNNLFCHVNLDGFTYERLGGNAPTDAKMRQEWLEKQRPQHLARDFRPQPFEQVVKVLRETGHEEEAKKIAIARKRYDLRNSFYRLKPKMRKVHPGARLMRWEYIKHDPHAFQETEDISDLIRRTLLFFESWFRFLFIDVLIGYGHRVTRAFWTALAVFVISSLIFYQAHEQGVMVPTDAWVFMDDALREACTDPHPNSKATWSACTYSVMGKEYTSLQPALYALDVILPLVSLGQEAAWEPALESFPFKMFGYTMWEMPS